MNKAFIYVSIISGALSLSACSSENREVQLPNRPPITNLSAQRFSMTEHAEYLLFLPKDYAPHSGIRWPVILFLHGIGESGSDIWKTTAHGPVKFIEKHPDFPFILISPQCPLDQKWSDEIVLGILDEVVTKYSVDTNRIYLTGLSMGGYGTWSLATMHAEYFAAAAPISGGGDMMGVIASKLIKKKTQPLQNLPFWVFHGAKDPIVPLAESERMVEALKSFGCKEVKLTTYPQAEHDAWTETYNNPELYEWFLMHQRKPESDLH